MAQINNWVSNLQTPLGIAIDPANTFLYEVDSGSQSINQIAISTGAITTIVSTGTFTTPVCIAVDSTNTFLYVSDSTAGTISTVTIATPTVTTWASGLTTPTEFVIDPTGTYMYVATQDGVGNATITQIPIASPGTLTVFTSGLINTVGGLAIDTANQYLYVANTDGAGNGQINQILIADGSLVTATWVTIGTYAPKEITIDSTGTYMYVAGNGQIARISIATPTTPAVWSNNLSSPYGVKIDPVGTYMYVSTASAIAKLAISFTPSNSQYYVCDQSANITSITGQSAILINQSVAPASSTILIDGQSYSGNLYTVGSTYYWSQVAPMTINSAQYYLCDQTANIYTTTTGIAQIPSGQGTWTNTASAITVQGTLLSGYLYTNGTAYYWSQVAPMTINSAQYYVCDQTASITNYSGVNQIPSGQGTWTNTASAITVQGTLLSGYLYTNGTAYYWSQVAPITVTSSIYFACNSTATNIPFTNSLSFTSGSVLPPSGRYTDTSFAAIIQGNTYAGFLYTDSIHNLYYWSSAAFIPSSTLFYPCSSNGTITSETESISVLPITGGLWAGSTWSASPNNQTIDGTLYAGYIYSYNTTYYWSQIAPFAPTSTGFYKVDTNKNFIDANGNPLPTFAPTSTTLPFDQWYGYVYTESFYGTPVNGYFYLNYSGTTFFWSKVKFIPKPVCFKEDTKILAKKSEEEEEQWIEVQDLRKGMLVKTVLDGFIKIDMIGHRDIRNPGTDERIKDRLYVCKPEKYPELFEDLIITGCHSILVKEITEEERAELEKEMGKIYVTDEHYRLMAMVDKRAEPYREEGKYTIWHFALENKEYYANYGVYANGLLVETCSKRMLIEISGMTLV